MAFVPICRLPHGPARWRSRASPCARARSQLEFKSGTRHARRAIIEAGDAHGGVWCAELVPQFNFYMSGLGYMHPEWGHGMYKGESALGYDRYDLSAADENVRQFLHVQ